MEAINPTFTLKSILLYKVTFSSISLSLSEENISYFQKALNQHRRLSLPPSFTSSYFPDGACVRGKTEQKMGKKRKHEVKDREEILRPRGGCIGAVVLFLSSRWYGFTLIWFREVISGKILQLESVTQSEAMRRRYRYLSHFSLTTTFQLPIPPLMKTLVGPTPSLRKLMFTSLASRLDSLVGLFGAGCQPSSTNDPFGLPRISYGLVQVLVEKDRNLDLQHALEVDASVKSLKIDVVTICEIVGKVLPELNGKLTGMDFRVHGLMGLTNQRFLRYVPQLPLIQARCSQLVGHQIF
ncbi:unnamed protein product [Lactuca saligna]|uniref:glycine--tRNA ligase n=1 Tax=Lactuca saligna TaxID=75948 RepID=A0AA35ZLP8_LACSI|nr:unnamed protein product [Lactuca saligna]